MTTDFDKIIDRRGSNSIKWCHYPEDVLPLWVADMDFAAPEPVQAALRHSVEHGIFGYEAPTLQLRELVAGRMDRLYGWKVTPEMVVATPGVIAGFNAAARTVCQAGQGVLVQPPVYPPFLGVHKNSGLGLQLAPLAMTVPGSHLRYGVDLEVFEKAVHSGGVQTGMFLLCNPHNPTGQAYDRDSLTRMAEICLNKGVILCSDEIHSELLLDGSGTSTRGRTQHIPIASLGTEIANRTITLIAPSKTFNIPGLFCAFAIIPNPDLRKRFQETTEQMAMHVNSLGLTAAQAAFSGACDGWLEELCAYLTGNRDFLVKTVEQEFGGIRITVPEATYLAWLDCNMLVNSGRITGTPHEHFLKEARVALNEGKDFGQGGEGFVRLNFGCPRKTLEEALEQMKKSLA